MYSINSIQKQKRSANKNKIQQHITSGRVDGVYEKVHDQTKNTYGWQVYVQLHLQPYDREKTQWQYSMLISRKKNPKRICNLKPMLIWICFRCLSPSPMHQVKARPCSSIMHGYSLRLITLNSPFDMINIRSCEKI